jgi:hypothetical protein
MSRILFRLIAQSVFTVSLFGDMVFRMTSYFLKNDYANLYGIGEETILAAWERYATTAPSENDKPIPPTIVPKACSRWQRR